MDATTSNFLTPEVNISGEDSKSPEGEIHLFDVLSIFASRWRTILICLAISASLAIVIFLLSPKLYTAEAVILPAGQGSGASSLMSQAGNLASLAAAGGGMLNIKNPGDLHLSLLRTRTVEDAVIRRFGLNEKFHASNPSRARKRLEKITELKLGLKDGLISIAVSDTDPKQAAVMANGYVEEYKKYTSQLAITEAAQRRLFFEQQLMTANEKLAAAEETMKATENNTGMLQVDSLTRSLIESAAALRAQIVAKEVQIHSMSTYETDDNPTMITATQELTALRAQLSKLGGSSESTDLDMVVPKGKIPDAQIAYMRGLRDVKYYETVSALLAKQYEQARMDEAHEGASFQIVDAATPPDVRSSPRLRILVPLAITIGFVFSCFWCLAAELRKYILNSPEEAKRFHLLLASFKGSHI